MSSVAPASALDLALHGICVKLRADDGDSLRELARDFSAWTAAPQAAPDLSLELRGLSESPADQGGFWWPGPGWRARDAAGARTVRYDAGAVAVLSHGGTRGRIYCDAPALRHELAFLWIVSRVGQRLDERGWHRVHALGLEWRGKAALILLPSGGGKTSLAVELLRRSQARFYSDDSPLLLPGPRVASLPLRWAARSAEDFSFAPRELVRPFERRRHGRKWLLDAEALPGRLDPPPAPLRWLIVGRRGGGPAAVEVLPRPWAAWPLFLGSVVGWGLPQMAEWTLGLKAAPRLARTAASRTLRAAQALAVRPAFELRLGASPAEGALALLSFLESQGRGEAAPC